MIAAADDPDVVREEGSAALAQAERLADVVTRPVAQPGPAGDRVAAALTGIDEIVQQQARGVGRRPSAGRAASSW